MILDVGLPDASGFEMFKRLRETSDVPVVFLTARSDEIDRVVGLELGADDYVAKPFSPRELVARVRGVLRRTAGRARPWPAAGRGARRARAPIGVDEGACRSATTAACSSSRATSSASLKTLASRPGHVFSRDTLLERVWDDDTESMDRTRRRARQRRCAPR